jgi:hypothetical protein
MKHFLAMIGAALLAACVQLASAQPALTPLTNADVIRYFQLGFTEQAVLNLISEAQSARLARFDLSASGVSDLTAHGVPATVVAAMGRPSPAGAVPSTAATPPVAADVTQAPVIKADCSATFAREIRALAKDLYAKNPNNPVALAWALDQAVGVDPKSGTFQRAAAISLSSAGGLMVVAFFPYDTFRTSVLEAIRKKEPIGEGIVPLGVRVVVSPLNINAPDIIKITVERDGSSIAPTASSLKPTELTTALGAKKTVNAGEVTFPCSAFAPGASVTVTAIPAIGSNLVKVLSSETLNTLK